MTFEVVVDDDVLAGTRILNQATVFEQRSLPHLRRPGTDALDDATVIVVGDVPDLSFTQKLALPLDENGDGVAQVGETLRYTVVVENRGAAVATGVVFRDVLEPNLVAPRARCVVTGSS